MLSTTAEYALRAVLFLAQEAGERPVQVGAIARALGIPHNYLSKILHELARGGVLTSARGRRGGFRLAVPADQLPLFDVVSRFDQIAAGRTCLLGRPECNDRSACAAHPRWKAVSEQVARFFQQTTVTDLLQGAPLHV
ncbi:MAG TPA: Rrf2 family transcriptional regulator [Gemmatimonadales bacterium]